MASALAQKDAYYGHPAIRMESQTGQKSVTAWQNPDLFGVGWCDDGSGWNWLPWLSVGFNSPLAWPREGLGEGGLATSAAAAIYFLPPPHSTTTGGKTLLPPPPPQTRQVLFQTSRTQDFMLPPIYRKLKQPVCISNVFYSSLNNRFIL